MHDIRAIRDDPAAFDAGLARRGLPAQSGEILGLDERKRALSTELQVTQARRNEVSKAIGQAKAKRDEAKAAALMQEIVELKEKLTDFAAQSLLLEYDTELLTTLPNIPAADVPDGADENDNVELARWGTPRVFDFAPREHADFGPALGLDFESAAAISGARFAVLRGQMARLNRAIGAFMLDTQTANGYEETAPPLLVRRDALFGTTQLPKFEEDLFKAGPDHWLIPTSEVSLTNLVREQILDEAALPLRFTALTPCFRAEAGAAGRDTRGLIRQHQFDKVEMVTIAHPDHSDAEHERMVDAAEGVLEALGLPYRRMLLCAGDMGFAARKTFDLEVWLPGQNKYREISSVSNCGDFQARRMAARFRPAGDAKGTRFVHTLNGSGLAVGRTLVAILENYQQADGSVVIPPALIPYMGGIDRLVAR